MERAMSTSLDATLTDEEISILCDVGDGQWVREKYRPILVDLVANRFVEVVNDEPTGYKLTGKATFLLAERGVGLNEA